MTAIETVKERPILFSGPMVRAILEGKKIQTRRVVKPMPFIDYPTGFRLQEQYELNHHPKCSFVQARMLCDCKAIYEPWKAERVAACPYGKPGERLWVRETWASQIDPPDYEEHLDELDDCLERTEITYRATPRIGIRVPGYIQPVDRMRYLDESTELEHHCFGWPIKWKPSIFMPRWASRITLEVTEVRVERLNLISEQDALAEGVYTNEQAIAKLNLPASTRLQGTCVDKFRILWESINGKTYPWASDPWVWVVSFRKIEPEPGQKAG